MTGASQGPDKQEGSSTGVIETAIRLGVVAILVVWCFQIIRPFLIPIVWGIVIATALYPAFERIDKLFGGRTRLAAAVFTLLGLTLLIGPTVLFADSVVTSVQWLAASLEDGTITVPPPPDEVAGWPVVGKSIDRFWALASSNLEQAIQEISSRLLGVGAEVLSAVAGAGIAVLQFALSIVIAGVMLAQAEGGGRSTQAIATRLAGERGPELADLAGATVRSVAQGILGVAVIQSLLLGVGMFAAGVPHTALWTLICLVLAVIQLPPLLVMLPVVAYQFSVAGTASAVLFTIWTLLAGASDNVLKPILLGRGLDLPMIVIFMGAIGGFITSGFIGLFVGAVVLALGYKLFLAWLTPTAAPGLAGAAGATPGPDPATP